MLDEGCRVVHIDGHQPETALYYVKQAREKGILTSLDGGTVRVNTDEILKYIDVAAVSERFCQVLGKSTEETIKYLLDKGAKVAAVTLGEQGVYYASKETDFKIENIPALPVDKEKVVDSTGAGDIFHGAYVYSFVNSPEKSWREHFEFAKVASALSIQKLGTEASIPSLDDIKETLKEHTL